jgi:hypothetical protein
MPACIAMAGALLLALEDESFQISRRRLCLPRPELCDGFDNDCKPAPPDGFDEPLFGQACDGPDADLCADDTFSVCVGTTLTCSPGEDNLELCNGIDDDCNATTPDGVEDPRVAACAHGSWPWTRTQYGGIGSYELPLPTFWDGAGWDPLGTVPDWRTNALWQGGIAMQYNCYANEITESGSRDGDPYLPADMEGLIDRFHTVSGRNIDFRNAWSEIQSDGTSDAIQIVPLMAVGNHIIGSPTPECDDPGDRSRNMQHGLFSLVFPPYYDTDRPQKYGLLLLNPGAGTTGMEKLFLTDGGLDAVEMVGASVEQGGSGVVVIIGNAGGRDAMGLQDEYADATNLMMSVLEAHANVDINRVVTVGGSRGGTSALFHASRPGRNYTVEAAFARAPQLFMGSELIMHVNYLPLHRDYPPALCWIDPLGCEFAADWDHMPPPGVPPVYGAGPIVNSTDVAMANAASPWGVRNGFDPGTWVELCSGPRDYLAGSGHLLQYYDDLVPHVTKRMNNVLGTGHGGAGELCRAHTRTYVLDKLAGRLDFAGLFDTEVDPGEFHLRLTTNDATPFDYDISELEPLQMGCGSRPPMLLLPAVQEYRQGVGPTEPSQVVILGTEGHRFKALLHDGSPSRNPIHIWEGRLGDDPLLLPPGCEYYPLPTSRDNVLCRYNDGIDLCVGPSPYPAIIIAKCGWEFYYDCDLDGVLETIDSSHTPYAPQAEAELWVSPSQCNGLDGCAPAPLGVERPPFGGVPASISPCWNPANTMCLPW